jgi:hypothetical protein
MFSRERTVQVYRNQTYFFTVSHQVVDSFASSFSYCGWLLRLYCLVLLYLNY